MPGIVVNGASHSVNLKFHTLGHFVNVCGSLSNDIWSMLHYVCLDICKYVKLLELMVENYEFKGNVNDEENIIFGNKVFEMWKNGKDRGKPTCTNYTTHVSIKVSLCVTSSSLNVVYANLT